jgi:hypothetical protein
VKGHLSHVSQCPRGPGQDARPAGRCSNWLLASKGEISLSIRCYRPDAAITEGKWTPPIVGKGYATKADCLKVIDLIKSTAGKAKVEDISKK